MVPLTNVVEIVVTGTMPTTGSGAKNIQNVFHYQQNGGSGFSALATIAAGFNSTVWAPIAANISVDWTGVSTTARYLDDATMLAAPSAAPPASGSVALPRLPVDLAMVFPLRCVTRGKNFRGSKHIAGIPTSYVTKDELNATGITAAGVINGVLANLFTIAGAVNFIPIVLSRSLSQLRVNPTTIIGSSVLAVLTNKTIGTMRHRREKTVR